MSETLYYITDYSDEIMPCAPELQAWADWLDQPDEDWNRPEPAKDGEEFEASSLDVLGDVRVEWRDGAWQAVEEIPPGTDTFFLRHGPGMGWDAEHAGNTIKDAADCLDERDGPLLFACTRDNPAVRIRFNRTPEGPRCVVLGAIQ